MWRGIWGHPLPYTVSLVQVRVDFKENWGGAEPKQCCNVMVEATNLHRLYPKSMSYVYTQCFSTLICCGWAYGCTLTLLRLCRSGVEFGNIELSPSPRDVVMSWLRLQTCLECIPHPCHMYTQCFSILICCGWAYGCTLHCYVCAGQGQGWILGKLS